jgi:hypothetical protein
MTRAMTEQEKAEKASERKRKKLWSHRMEVIRTVCAMIALVLNSIVLLHVIGVW